MFEFLALAGLLEALQFKAFSAFLPYLLAPLVFIVVQGLKKGVVLVDRIPSWAKPGLVYVVAQVTVFLQTWTGQALACGADCTLLDLANAPTFIKGVLVTLSAMLLHFLKNRPVPSK